MPWLCQIFPAENISSPTTCSHCQDVIMAAIKDEGAAFEYAAEELKTDYDFALEVVAMGGPGEHQQMFAPKGDATLWIQLAFRTSQSSRKLVLRNGYITFPYFDLNSLELTPFPVFPVVSCSCGTAVASCGEVPWNTSLQTFGTILASCFVPYNGHLARWNMHKLRSRSESRRVGGLRLVGYGSSR